MIVHKPLVARPNLTWSDILNVLDVGSRQISQALEKLERGLDAVHICAERFINPNQIVDIILGIPKWIKAALIVLCTFATITLGLWIKHVITKFMKCCKQKPKRTVAISEETPTLIRTRSLMSIPSRRNSQVSIVQAPVGQQANPEDEYLAMYPQITSYHFQTVIPSVPPFSSFVS